MGMSRVSCGRDAGEQLVALAEFRFLLRTFLSFSESRAESGGITAQQYQLLQVIGAAGEQGASITQLAKRMLLRHNSAVELVDRAERAGLVQRVADEQDLRRSIVETTAKGRELLDRLVQEHLSYLSQAGPELVDALKHATDGEMRNDEA